MQFSGDYFTVIESPFSVEFHSMRVSLSPEDHGEEAFQPIRQLVGQIGEKATADTAGALHLRFDNGTRLEVPADESSEAWRVSGPNGALAVCTPSGKLAIWSGRTQS